MIPFPLIPLLLYCYALIKSRLVSRSKMIYKLKKKKNDKKRHWNWNVEVENGALRFISHDKQTQKPFFMIMPSHRWWRRKCLWNDCCHLDTQSHVCVCNILMVMILTFVCVHVLVPRNAMLYQYQYIAFVDFFYFPFVVCSKSFIWFFFFGECNRNVMQSMCCIHIRSEEKKTAFENVQLMEINGHAWFFVCACLCECECDIVYVHAHIF